MSTAVQSMIAPDLEAIKKHLGELFEVAQVEYPEGLVELRHGPPDNLTGHAYFFITPMGLQYAAEHAVRRNSQGENVYVGVNPRKPGTTRQASAADVEIAFYHFADIDKAGPVGKLSERLAPLLPTMSVTTGTLPNRRPHLYWRLEEPVRNMAEWSARQAGIADALEGDRVIDAPRIMRLGGTVNFPTQKKLQAGYKVELTGVRTQFTVERTDVTPDMIRTAFPAKASQSCDTSVQLPASMPAGATTLSLGRTKLADLMAACQSGDEWHNNMTRLVAHMAAIGRSDVEILGLAAGLTLPGYTVQDTWREMATALRGARVKWSLSSPVDEETADVTEARPLRTVDAFAFDEAAIPVRPWIVPGVMLARHTHMLVAPGGSGKSLFTLQMAIMLATGQQWGDWKPKRRCKSLIINVEDDLDEQRRRLSAARNVMAPQADLLTGMIHLAEEPDTIVVAKVDPLRKSVVATPIVEALCTYIRDNDIDVLIVDPFAETFEGDENSNSEVKWAMKVWRDQIARVTGCAVYLIHHTVKYASGGAGNADMIRGAGAIVNSTRISSTLFTMTDEEAKALGVPVDERNMYVRFDDAKANQTLKSRAKWFEKVSVVIGNGGGFDEPDEVGALRPWTPPDAFSGLTGSDIKTALLMIDRGLEDDQGRPSGVLYTNDAQTKDGVISKRWAGHPVMAALGVNEERAKLIVKGWVSNKMLVRVEYDDPEQRKKRWGVVVSKDHMAGLDA